MADFNLKNFRNTNVQKLNFEGHIFSLENQVGFHFVDGVTPAHIHDGFAEFSLIISGEWENNLEDKTYILKKDTLIFLGNNTLHSLNPITKGCNHFTFFFKEEYLKKFLDTFFPNNPDILSTKYKEITLASSVSAMLLYEAQRMCGSRTAYDHNLEFQNYMHNLIFFMFFSNNVPSKASNDNTHGYSLRKYFDNYMLLNDSLKNIYSMFPICPTTLIKQFENVTGQTIVQYRNEKRMEYASFLLRDCNITVLEVANTVGISSPSHFSAEFKKKFGISPKDFAKQNKV